MNLTSAEILLLLLLLCNVLCSSLADISVEANPLNIKAHEDISGRRLQTADCILLLKITTNRDRTESEEVDCYDPTTDTISKITTEYGDEIIQKQLVHKMNHGILMSAKSTMKPEAGAYFADGNLYMPLISEPLFGEIDRREQVPPLEGRRLTTHVTGTKKMVAVRVVAKDASTSFSEQQLSDKWFGIYGDQLNFKSQIQKCSYGQVQPTAYNGNGVSNGVITVKIDRNVINQDRKVIEDVVKNAVPAFIRDTNNVDHYMICMPSGTVTSSGGDWIGYAYVNYNRSVFNDRWCTYPSIQMHEIGHNFGLAHSGENSSYDDQSAMMGYSYSRDDGPAMCFNAPKNKQLGWYTEYEVDVSGGWKGKIYGVATKDLASKGEDVVLARIPGSFDFYVSFNAKRGINSGTLEGANQVLVHVRNRGFTYGESTLVAKLSAGQTYKDANLPITVNLISSEFYAEVTIGTVTDSPTRSPINSPTRSPVIVQTSAPTKSPVAAPTTILNDETCQDTVWKFLLRVKPDGKKLFRKCGWVTSKPGKEQARCRRSRVQSFCPKACSPYTNAGSEIYCSQDAKGKFALDDKIATLARCYEDKAKSRCNENEVNAVCRATCPSQSSTQSSESNPEQVTSYSYTTAGNIHWTIFGRKERLDLP